MSIWRRYRDLGLVVWLVAPQDSPAAAKAFAEELGVTMPVLVDEGSAVYAKYGLADPHNLAPFPRNWLVGADGRVVYFGNQSEVSVMEQHVAAELQPGMEP